MNKLIIIVLLRIALPENTQNTVVETLFKDFDLRTNTVQTGILATPDHLQLYDMILKSELKFETKNPYENWSLELDISIPKLKYPERSTMRLWYSPDEENDSFKGFVATINFIGKEIELSIHIHENKDEEEKFVVDYIDRSLLDDYEKITIKIIHTEKNIKLELLHEKTLIYDHLRLLDKKYFGKHNLGGKFKITADYNHKKNNQKINLYDARLYERKESDNYNVNYDEVPTNNEEEEKYEVSGTVASLEQFIKYWDVIFGVPKGITIAKLAKAGRNDYIKLGNEIEKVRKGLQQTKKIDDMVLYEKIANLESFIKNVERKMGDFDTLMKILQKNTSSFSISYACCFFILFTTISFIVYSRNLEHKRESYKKI